jgi:hypothetical protein
MKNLTLKALIHAMTTVIAWVGESAQAVATADMPMIIMVWRSSMVWMETTTNKVSAVETVLSNSLLER